MNQPRIIKLVRVEFQFPRSFWRLNPHLGGWNSNLRFALLKSYFCWISLVAQILILTTSAWRWAKQVRQIWCIGNPLVEGRYRVTVCFFNSNQTPPKSSKEQYLNIAEQSSFFWVTQTGSSIDDVDWSMILPAQNKIWFRCFATLSILRSPSSNLQMSSAHRSVKLETFNSAANSRPNLP